jgi:hypothetical protein
VRGDEERRAGKSGEMAVMNFNWKCSSVEIGRSKKEREGSQKRRKVTGVYVDFLRGEMGKEKWEGGGDENDCVRRNGRKIVGKLMWSNRVANLVSFSLNV